MASSGVPRKCCPDAEKGESSEDDISSVPVRLDRAAGCEAAPYNIGYYQVFRMGLLTLSVRRKPQHCLTQPLGHLNSKGCYEPEHRQLRHMAFEAFGPATTRD